jgi:L-aminopeptidase/D-esterase-like protein
VGSAARRLPGGQVVGALVVNNALGDVYARAGSILAGRPADAAQSPSAGNTVLIVVATDVSVDRAQACKLAELGHDALARGIRPAHTMFDGDVVFAVSSGDGAPSHPEALLQIGPAVDDAIGEAIERSVAG